MKTLCAETLRVIINDLFNAENALARGDLLFARINLAGARAALMRVAIADVAVEQIAAPPETVDA